MATARKMVIASSFTQTMAALTRALSLTPTISITISSRTIEKAGKLTMPPASGPFVSSGGRPRPIAVSALLKYPDQPFATAATETPYSRIKSQAMIQATNSPKAA